MTIKQFKKRWIRSMVEPELIYMPVEEKKDGILQVTVKTYTVYDYDEKQYLPSYGMQNLYSGGRGFNVIVLNSANKIVYNSKKTTNPMNNSYIISLPYGAYKIKVIEAFGVAVDNKWHKVVLNKSYMSCEIILPWTSFYKTESYLEDKVKNLYIANRPSDCNTTVHSATENSRYVCDYYECNCGEDEKKIYTYYPCNTLPCNTILTHVYGFVAYTPATASLYSNQPSHDIHAHYTIVKNITTNHSTTKQIIENHKDFYNTIYDTTGTDVSECYVDRYGETVNIGEYDDSFYAELMAYRYSYEYAAIPVIFRQSNWNEEVNAYDCATPLSIHGFTPINDIINICQQYVNKQKTWEELFPEYWALEYIINNSIQDVDFFTDIELLEKQRIEYENDGYICNVVFMGRANEIPITIAEKPLYQQNTITMNNKRIKFNNQLFYSYSYSQYNTSKITNAWVDPNCRSHIIQFEYRGITTYSDDYDQY